MVMGKQLFHSRGHSVESIQAEKTARIADSRMGASKARGEKRAPSRSGRHVHAAQMCYEGTHVCVAFWGS